MAMAVVPIEVGAAIEVGEQQVGDTLGEVQDPTVGIGGRRIGIGHRQVGQYRAAVVVVTAFACRSKPGPDIGDASGPHLVRVDFNHELDLEGIRLGGHVLVAGAGDASR